MTNNFILFQETSPNRKKSRNEKFHKLFKIVPEHEFPIDYFSCAFISDNFMLLQGNLYTSQNWFCFYSRIRGRGRLIPMEKVISITREKTALVFPNAIGFQTAAEKYVFGSFLTRDSTYKFLVKLWKQSTEKHQRISAHNVSTN
ncbi:hypothetical protein FSP39_022252 [Pinctada imbricata]|uniref:GRAM domain-containing protein n=1 Tax=Pinctada imbricata TaxID=66713 RepID=A0AA88YG21_PINIB|nr:hypothetical protein FSP39_022252 [Pinctada imbricata]